MQDLKTAAAGQRIPLRRSPCATDAALACIWFPEAIATLVEVWEELLPEISVVVDDVVGLSSDAEIGVAYEGSVMLGHVRYTQPLPDGRYLVGLNCDLTL